MMSPGYKVRSCSRFSRSVCTCRTRTEQRAQPFCTLRAKMNKTFIAFIGVLLLALSAQVVRSEANNTNLANTTMTTPMGTTTTNGCERTAGFTLLLLPLALAASVLHDWSQ